MVDDDEEDDDDGDDDEDDDDNDDSLFLDALPFALPRFSFRNASNRSS